MKKISSVALGVIGGLFVCFVVGYTLKGAPTSTTAMQKTSTRDSRQFGGSGNMIFGSGRYGSGNFGSGARGRFGSGMGNFGSGMRGTGTFLRGSGRYPGMGGSGSFPGVGTSPEDLVNQALLQK